MKKQYTFIIFMMIFAINNLVTGSDNSPKFSNDLTAEQITKMNKYVEIQRTNEKLTHLNQTRQRRNPRGLNQNDLEFLANIGNSQQIDSTPNSDPVTKSSPQSTAAYPFSPNNKKHSPVKRTTRYSTLEEDSDEETY